MAKPRSGQGRRSAQQPLPHRQRELIRKMEEILTELEACQPPRPVSVDDARRISAALAKDVLEALKQERLRQGMSLADVRARSGIERSALCKLENDEDGNPTLRTLSRYAAALGKQLRLVLEDLPSSASE